MMSVFLDMFSLSGQNNQVSLITWAKVIAR